MKKRTHILVVESSLIIRSGITAVLKHLRLPTLNIDIAELSDCRQLMNEINQLSPDILILNPSLLGSLSPSQIAEVKEDGTSLKLIALVHTLTDQKLLQAFNDVINIYDTVESIQDKLQKQIESSPTEDSKQELSTREKEIVVCVVKGMTNKQIADKLFLSTHTITTHRRNISNKLQIHSPAGLTIYAIVNKLVDIQEL